MNRTIYFISWFGIFCVASTAFVQTETLDRIVARVDDSVITQSDLNEAIAGAVEEIRSKYPPDQWEKKAGEVRNQILMQMIDEHVCSRAARDLEITISEEEIEGYIQNMWKKAGISSEEQFKEELRREGITIDELRASVKRQALARKVLQREVYSKVSVSEMDIKSYYEENKTLYHLSDQVRVGLLLAAVQSESAYLWKAAEAKIRMIDEKIKGGADFAEMVKQYSDGPAVDQSGDVGFMEKGKALAEIEEVAFKVPEGQVSEPFKTKHGWNVIKVLEKKPESYRSLEEARSEIEALLQKMKSRDLEKEWLEKQRTRTFIEIVKE